MESLKVTAIWFQVFKVEKADWVITSVLPTPAFKFELKTNSGLPVELIIFVDLSAPV